MKKILVILFLAAIALSSCLKDKPNTDFSNLGPAVVELPWSGLQYFGLDAVTAPDDTIHKSFGVNIASKSPLSTDTKYTVAVDNSLLTAYVAAHPNIDYLPMPAGSYALSKTSGTIKAGTRLDSVGVTFYKNQLDPSKSYMLPVKLASATNGILSGNFNAHYYHFIGNDFAGNYLWAYTRTPPAGNFPGNPTTLFPIDPTHLSIPDNYFTGKVKYIFSFTKTGSGPTAVYTNLHVELDAATVASELTANGISVVAPATFVSSGTSDLPGPYTYSQVVSLFDFTYKVFNGSANRTMEDRFYH